MRDDRDRARDWWANLSPAERWELGDAFVLGTFDWRDWFDDPPSRAFLAEVEYQRLLWEQTL